MLWDGGQREGLINSLAILGWFPLFIFSMVVVFFCPLGEAGLSWFVWDFTVKKMIYCGGYFSF